MTEARDTNAVTRALNASLTLVLFAAVLGIPYVWDRMYSRWSKENHLFAAPRARVDRLKTHYRSKRANATEVAAVVGGMLVELVMASQDHPRK
jgi:hypothetical protein